MALFNKKSNPSNSETIPEPIDDSDYNDTLSGIQDEITPSHQQPVSANPELKRKSTSVTVIEEEDDISSEVSSSLPIRKKRSPGHYAETAEDDEAILVVPSQPALKRDIQQTKGSKVSLSTEISRDLHARLRIQSFKTGSPLGTLIEEMIITCYPE